MESWNWEALLSDESPLKAERDVLGASVADVLVIREHTVVPHEVQPGRRWVGSLRMPADEALARLKPVFAGQGFTAMVQETEKRDEVAIVAMPGIVQPTSSRLWLAQLLFVLTVISTIVMGAIPTDESLVWRWADGLMYSGTLLSILLAHELGHFIAARRLGVAVSYPFFIPMPLVIFGTMGAFIQMKEMPPDRRVLFTIAVAGPLAGLAIAIPLTLLGLYLSTVGPLPTEGGYILEGNSLLYAGMKWLIFGQWLPNGSEDVLLHPIAWAGWAGLLVTALNLLPAGQLDGGHVVFALLGRRLGQMVTYGVIGLMIAMGFSWAGWWVWALLIFFLANRHLPILNDVTPPHRTPTANWLLHAGALCAHVHPDTVDSGTVTSKQ